MAVVVNEFEVVPEPAPAPAPASQGPPPEPPDLERLLARQRARDQRVRAY
jgi:hypothetical protein